MIAFLIFFLSLFHYDLHLSTIEGEGDRTMICCHGYGANYKIGSYLHKQKFSDATLVSFNFPDHDLLNYDFHQASFGTIDELLPVFYVLKQTVLDKNLESVDLYGFSAGGGAVINVIAILNGQTYDAELKKVGIGKKEKMKLLSAIQKGVVILDTPLKSVEEIIDFRGSTEELEVLAKNYRKNHLRPIDSLERLKGLSLKVRLHFQTNDEVLSNRDDQLFIKKLKEANSLGITIVIIEDDGGHLAPHYSLWK